MKRIIALLMLFLLAISSGCGGNHPRAGTETIKFYADIRGVTKEEISTIEKIKKSKGNFTYGHLLTTESFVLQDGTYAGFTIKVCERLSELFDIEFTPKLYDERDGLEGSIDNQSLDFSGEFTQTPERMKKYYMTAPISGRGLILYMLKDSMDIKKETDVNGRKIGFLVGTVADKMIHEHYPEISFEVVEVPGFLDAVKMLKTGAIDVFITDGVADTIFKKYDFIQGKELFQLVYSPVSITTKNPELQPIISVINKYLNNGGAEELLKLYKEGDYQYKKHKLTQSLTEGEKGYMADLKAKNAKVNIGIQHDGYPVTFYNEMDNKFEGIALDILKEITKLTDIEFEPITTSTDMPLSEILDELKDGKISMVTQLLYTDSRKNDYIWSAVPYHTTNYALLSKSEYPDLKPFQVYYARVGTIAKSAHEEMFSQWFPNHKNTFSYPSSNSAFDALERDEVDMVMMAENMLLAQTNYSEKTGYKINMSFNKSLSSAFGYNKNEEVLRNIVDKALDSIDIKNIERQWLSRTFNYATKISQMQTSYLAIFSGIVLIVLILILFMLLKNKRLGKRLLEHTASLTTIYKAIPDIIFSMNTNLVYKSCNSSFEKIAGKPQEDIIGKTDNEVFGTNTEMVAYFTEVNTKVLNERKTYLIQEWVTYPDGERKYLETIKTPLFQDGKLTGLMGIARDITEIHSAVEEARDASKAKSQFLASMSHEIRTPMNAIIGMSELLLNEPLNERQKGYLKDISISSHSLLSIINDILDLSKIESGKMELNPVDYDFQIFIDNICSVFNFVTQKKGLEFIFETEGDMPKAVFGDDIRLRQVLTNIFGNAAKFTNTGFIRLRVTNADEMLIFEIKDTGIGIREEDIPKLFDAFTQTDLRKNRNITGTGLGLPISKSFVEMMDGYIKVESVYGEGTVFTIAIPMVLGDESAIMYKNRKKDEKMFLAPSAKILVVDDNEMNLKVATGLFSLFKISVQTASSGKEAIDLIKETDYDIVFMDHMMPEMDGIEATNELRKLGGKYERIIIIALTANAISGARETFMANGFNGFLSKPINLKELTDILLGMLPPPKIEPWKKEPQLKAEVGDNNGFLDYVKRINGINVEIGMSRVSEIEDMYRENLDFFNKKLLSDCEKMDGFLKGNDLQSLAISVHGMKASLATIGAMELSKTAFELEDASKAEDSSYCKEHLPEFLAKLRLMHEQLSVIFVNKEPASQRSVGDTKYLRESVQAALAAANDFDATLAVETIKKLLGYDFGAQTNTTLEDAKSALDDFDFDSAVYLLKNIQEQFTDI